MKTLKSISRRAWEYLAHLHLAAWLIVIGQNLLSQWSLIVSAAIAIATAYWAWASQWGYLPIFLVAFGIFVAAIWGLNGVIWLRRQRRPSRERVAFDFSYGLSLQGLQLGRDESKEDAAFQLGLVLFNAADWPIKYEIEDIDVIVGNRAIARPTFVNRGGVISRRCSTMFFYPPFPKNAMKERTDGILQFSIVYGHPEFGFARRMKKRLSMSLRLDDKPGVVYIIEMETDDGISA